MSTPADADDEMVRWRRWAAELQLLQLAEVAVAGTVQEMRAAGVTWRQIGTLLGVTRQAAQQKYGRVVAARSDVGMPPALPGLAI